MAMECQECLPLNLKGSVGLNVLLKAKTLRKMYQQEKATFQLAAVQSAVHTRSLKLFCSVILLCDTLNGPSGGSSYRVPTHP